MYARTYTLLFRGEGIFVERWIAIPYVYARKITTSEKSGSFLGVNSYLQVYHAILFRYLEKILKR